MSNQTDPALVQALIDLQMAEDAIERATMERDEIAAYIRRHKKYASSANGVRRGKKSIKDETMAESLEAVLSASDVPMLVPDIVSALQERGRSLTSANPAAHISSSLSRGEQFKYEKGIGWTFQSP